MKKNRLIRFLKIFLPLAIGVFFVFYSYFNFTPDQRQVFFKNITQISPLWVVTSIAGGLLAHLSRALRWRLLLRPICPDTRLSTTFMAVMGGYLANLGIPRSGEILRAASVATYEKIPFEKVLGTIIVERAVDVLVVSCILVVTVFLHSPELLTLFEQYHINPWISLLGLLVLIIAGIGILILIKKSRLRIFSRIRRSVSGVLEGVRSILRIKNKGVFLFHTFFIWGMYILTFYILKFGFPEMENIGLSNILVAFMAGSFAVSITNGGVGIYPIVIGAALSLFGISKEVSEAFGWVDWGTQTILSVVVGGFSLILLPILHKKRVNSETEK